MKNDLKKKLDSLLTYVHVPVEENDLDVYEQVIHDRGVSAGYFNIHIEDISELTIIEQVAYIEGEIHGIEKFESLTDEQKEMKHYSDSKHSYLESLGYWSVSGEIQILDSSNLNDEELMYFNKGIEKANGELELKNKAKQRTRNI